MKKAIAVLLLVAFVACSAFANGSAESASSKEKVGISMFVMDAGMTQLVSLMTPVLEEAGYEVCVTSADSSMSKQASDIEDLVTKGCKIIWCQGFTEEAIASAFEYAIDRGVMIASGSALADSTPRTYVYQNSSVEAQGRMQAAWLVENYLSKNPDHVYKIALCNGTLSTSGGAGRRDGILNGLAESGYTNYEIIAEQDCDYITETAQQWAESLMTSHPEVEVVVCANDDMALGVANAIEAAGRTGTILLLGVDGMDVAKSLFDEGKLSYTVKFNVSAIGAGFANSMLQCLNGTIELDENGIAYGDATQLYSNVDASNYNNFF